MYNNPYYMPGFNPAMNMRFASPNMMRGIPTAMPATRALAGTARTANAGGLFSRLGSSLSGIRAINWGGLINNTSKTLGIINQTIPLVRQVGPMVNNMKSMLRVASLFKDETDNQETTTSTRTNIKNQTTTNNNTTNTSNNLTTNNKPQNLYTKTTTNTTTSNQQTKTTIRTSTTSTKSSKEEDNTSPTFFLNN